MKIKNGIIKNTKKGWIMRYLTPATGDMGTYLKELPLHPNDIKKIERKELFENQVVDFNIIEPDKHALYFEMITYAKTDE